MSFTEQVLADPIGETLSAWLKIEQARLDRKLIESRLQAESYMQPSYLNKQQDVSTAGADVNSWVKSNPLLALAIVAALGGLVYVAVK